MERIDSAELSRFLSPDDIEAVYGGDISICGCVHKIKNAGGFYFVMLRTGRYIYQTVYTSGCKGDFAALCEGAYVRINGVVKKEERAPYGFEITLSSFEILSAPKEAYPLPVSANHLGVSIETSMENRHTSLRHPEERAVFKINEGVVSAFRLFMLENGFTEIHTPKITALNTDDKHVFKLKYFGENACLAKSPTLYKQSCVAVFDRVFETGHAYKADKHNSPRHLNEFMRLDFEMAFIDGLHDIMAMETAMLKFIISHLKEHYRHEINMLEADIPDISTIPSVTFSEAMEILGKSRRQYDLDPTDEVKLCKWAHEKHSSEFIFVEKLPAQKRPVYTMRLKEDDTLTESFVLLHRGMEISTGGQSIHDYYEMLNIDEQSAYLGVLRYGMPPHGGMRLGLERFVMKLIGLENIRQASLFPRDMHHLKP